MRNVLLSCSILAGLALASGAHAAGYALVEQSAESQGVSHAGAAARADDPSTLFYNPAGMARLPGYQITVSGSYISPSASLQSGSASTNVRGGTLPVSGVTGTDAARDAFLPALYATAQIGRDWHVGLSVTSPFGLTTKYDTSSIARYYALTSVLRTTDIAPSVAWQALPNLSFGASLIVETADARLSNAVDFGTIGAGAGLARFGLLPGRADGIATVRGGDAELGYQLGVIYEPIPGTRLGLDYRSTIYHKVTGSVSFQNVPALLAPSFPYQRASAKLITPGNLTLGLAQDVGPVTLLGGLTYTQWGRFQQLQANFVSGGSLTEEKWHDTVTVNAGADWHLNDALTLRAGVAYDQTPVKSQYRTPRIPDGDRYWISVGATYAVTKNISVSAAYSHIFVQDTKVSLTDLGAGTPNFLRGNLNANYSNAIDIFATQAKLAF